VSSREFELATERLVDVFELLRMRQAVENGHGDERLSKLALIRLKPDTTGIADRLTPPVGHHGSKIAPGDDDEEKTIAGNK